MKKDENYSELEQAYDSGWQQGYKKGYIAAMEEADEWVDEEDEEDFEPIEWKLPDTPTVSLKTYGISEEEHPCVGCDCECCPVCDFEEENLEEIEALYQAGELEPDTAKAYEMGKNYGFEQGMKELSIASEENYLEGYKDALLGEPCFIEDEEIEKILEDIKERKKDYNLSYDTDFLDLIKDLQDAICKLHKYSKNPEFKRNLYDIFHLVTEITQLMVMKPVYEYWVKLEDE